MAESMLLSIARESILEVLEAKRRINVENIKKQEPLLAEPCALCVTLFMQDTILGSSGTIEAEYALLDTLIYHAKIAAFEDKNSAPITTSQYLHLAVDIALITGVTPLHTPDFEAMLHVREQHRGLFFKSATQELMILPHFEIDTEHLQQELIPMQNAQVFYFDVEHANDKPILKDAQ